MGVQAAVHSEDGKNQGRVGQTKVKRYWPGRAPDWVEEGGEEEELVQEQQEERSRTSVAAPVVVKKADDPRLARLADARSVRAPEVRARHVS